MRIKYHLIDVFWNADVLMRFSESETVLALKKMASLQRKWFNNRLENIIQSYLL
jgi:hypothetical protein